MIRRLFAGAAIACVLAASVQAATMLEAVLGFREPRYEHHNVS